MPPEKKRLPILYLALALGLVTLTILSTGPATAAQPPYQPTNPSPTNGSTDISTTTTLSAYVQDPDGDTLNVSFYWANGTHIQTNTNVPSGTRTNTTPLNLNHDTTYIWYVNATDPGGASNTSPTSTPQWTITTQNDWNTGTLTNGLEIDSAPGDLRLGYSNGTPGDDLIGFWRLNEQSTGTVTDHSGENNDGTTQNFDGDEFIDGTLETGAFYFDGSDDTVGYSLGTVPTNTFTLEFWANPNATHEIDSESTSGYAGLSGQKYAFGADQKGSDAGAGVSVGINGISVYEHGDSYMPALAVYSGTLSGWNHIVIVYNNKQPSIYLNGDLVRTGLTSPKTTVYAPASTFGSGEYGYYKGALDNVKIYNKSLNTSEINAHYNGTNPLNENFGGTHTSEFHDFNSSTSFTSFTPNATVPATTSINYTFRSSPDGTTGNASQWYTDITQVPNNRYLQIRTNLSTTDITKSPVLHDYQINASTHWSFTVEGTQTLVWKNATDWDNATTEDNVEHQKISGNLSLNWKDGFDDGSIGTEWSTTDQDGSVGTSFSESGGQLWVEANGDDLWGSTDQYGSVYTTYDGNFTAVTKVDYQENTGDWARTGIVARNDMTASGASTGYVFMVVTPGAGFAFQYDSNGDGYIDSGPTNDSSVYPAWLKLEKRGDTFTGYYAKTDPDNGGTWIQLGTGTPAGVNTVQDLGILTCSYSGGIIGTTKHDYFLINPGNGTHTTHNKSFKSIVNLDTLRANASIPAETGINATIQTSHDGTIWTDAHTIQLQDGNHTYNVTGYGQYARMVTNFTTTNQTKVATVHSYRLTATTGEGPTINNFTPADGATTTTNQNLSASVNDRDTPMNVSFYWSDGTLIQTVTGVGNGTVEIDPGTLSVGNHSWYVKATDSQGDSNISSTMTFTANQATVISISLSNTPIQFGNLDHGTQNATAQVGNGFPLNVTIKNTTNVNVNLTLKGDDFLHSTTNDTFGITNLTYTGEDTWTITSRADWDSTTQSNGLEIDSTPGDLRLGYQNGTPGDDLVGFWRLNEQSTGTVTDHSGENNDGTTQNFDGDEFTDGVFSDGGFDLDGSNDHVELPGFPNQQTSFTIEAWIYTDDSAQAGQRIFCDDESNTGGYAFSLGDPGDGAIRFYSRNMDTILLDTGTGVIQSKTWHHVVAVADISNNSRYIYVDGNVEASDTTDTGTWGTDTGPASIGGETDAGETTGRFNGIIDEVRIYNRTLTQTEITKHYEGTNPLNENFGGTHTTQNHDWGNDATPETIDINSTLNGQTVNYSVEVSDDNFTTITDRTSGTLTGGPETIDITGLTNHRYLRTTYNLSTTNVTTSPSIHEHTTTVRLTSNKQETTQTYATPPPFTDWINITAPTTDIVRPIYFWLTTPTGQPAGTYTANVTVKVYKD